MKTLNIKLLICVTILILCQKTQIINIESNDQQPIALNFETNQDQVQILKTEENTLFFTKNSQNILSFHDLQNKNTQNNQQISTLIQSQSDLHVKSNFSFQQNANSLYIQDKPQWRLVYQENFQGEIIGWSKQNISQCGQIENQFLGGYCNFAGQEVNNTIKDLPPHNQIKMQFNYHFIDNWEGESAYAKIDGMYAWTQSYKWCDKMVSLNCLKLGINICGGETPDKLSHHVSIVSAHSQQEITLSFGSTLQQDACTASWGIDDIMIFIQ